MHAYLIAGGNDTLREHHLAALLDKWHISVFDRVVLGDTGESVTIAQVREFQKRLTLKPYTSSKTAGIIRHAENLTQDAQHALLKTLEEPPVHAMILLETENPSVLLSTVISRCHIIRLDNPQKGDVQKERDAEEILTKLLASDPSQQFRILDTAIKTTQEADAFIDSAIILLRRRLVTQPSKQSGKTLPHISMKDASLLLRRLLTAKNQLAVHVNFRLVTDHIFLP